MNNWASDLFEALLNVTGHIIYIIWIAGEITNGFTSYPCLIGSLKNTEVHNCYNGSLPKLSLNNVIVKRAFLAFLLTWVHPKVINKCSFSPPHCKYLLAILWLFFHWALLESLKSELPGHWCSRYAVTLELARYSQRDRSRVKERLEQ